MTGRKPSRRETLAAAAEVAARMQAWISECRDGAAARVKRDEKARMLAGDFGGGSGVTLEMQRISHAAAARPVERVFSQSRKASPNRATRRWEARRTPRVFDRRKARWHHPMPSSRNVAYVNPARVSRRDRA